MNEVTTVTEEIQAEVDPPGPPPGSPHLVPIHKMNRRARVGFVRQMRVLSAYDLDSLKDPTKAAETPDPAEETDSLDSVVTVMELIADFETTLRLAAADPEAFDGWAATCTDQQLMDLGTWYMNDVQTGEASASSS